MKKTAAILAGAMLMFTFSTGANALSIRLTEGAFSTTINDGIGDGDGQISLINYQFNDFNINFIGGSSSLPNDPAINSLEIVSFLVRNTVSTVKTLTVQISDTNYSLNPVYPGPLNALATFGTSGGSANGTIGRFNAYLDANNTLFGKATTLGKWYPNVVAGSSSAIYTPTTLTGAPFSLTEEISLTQNGGKSASFDANVQVAPVPEPGTMVLLGAGLLGLAVYGKRRMNNKEA